MSKRPRLLFVSPRFLFPADEGGKIRTTQILRGMRGGRFAIRLMSPATATQQNEYARHLSEICDAFSGWPAQPHGRWRQQARLRHLFSSLPLSIAALQATSGTHLAKARIRQQLDSGEDLAVFDFAHAALFAPHAPVRPTLLFTHNVEAEIFARHAQVARNPLKRQIWRAQARKMAAFEAAELPRFDTVIAVSERDADSFRALSGIGQVAAIPTGVDLDYFAWHPPTDHGRILFTGALDWQANRDGISWFMDTVWPLLVQQCPQARMTLIGRNPPADLVARAQRRNLPWTFTGLVEDIRPHARGAAVSVIPLRVGGGTRIKAYEAMAMGPALVSTTLGVEGLPLVPDEHYLRADTPQEIAAAIARLLTDAACCLRLSHAARRYVETHCSSLAVARCFEDICMATYEQSC